MQGLVILWICIKFGPTTFRQEKRLKCTCPEGKRVLSFPCPTFDSTWQVGKN